MKTKVCNVCNIEKSETEYYKKGSGLQYRCKQCVKNHIKYEKCPKCDRQKRLDTKLCGICSRNSQREVYSQELINQVIDLYNSGLSTWKIADQIGSYQMKIRRILHRNNIQLRENDFVNNGKYGKDNPKWVGYGEISGAMFRQIKNSADKRNIEFNITIEFLDQLFKMQNKKCALSGLDISLPYQDQDRSVGNYTASLDRINSNIGYIEENVQWVHKWVNKMKQNLQEDEFLFLCDAIVKHSDKEIKTIDIKTLTQYKRRMKKDDD